MFPTELIDLIVTFFPPELVLAFTMVSKRYSRLLVPKVGTSDLNVNDRDPTFGTFYFQFPLLNEHIFEGEKKFYSDYKLLAMFRSSYSNRLVLKNNIISLQELRDKDIDDYFVSCLVSGALDMFDFAGENIQISAHREKFYYRLYILAFSKERVDWLMSKGVFVEFWNQDFLLSITSLEAYQYIYSKHWDRGINIFMRDFKEGSVLRFPTDIFAWLISLKKLHIENVLINLLLTHYEINNFNIIYLKKINAIDDKELLELLDYFPNEEFYQVYNVLSNNSVDFLITKIPFRFFDPLYKIKKEENSSFEIRTITLKIILRDGDEQRVRWILGKIRGPLFKTLDQLDFGGLSRKSILMLLTCCGNLKEKELKVLRDKSSSCQTLREVLQKNKQYRAYK